MRGAAIVAAALLAAAPIVLAPTPAAVAEPAAPPPITLQDVIGRYLAWRGGVAFEALQSVHYVTAGDGAAAGSREVWLDRQGRRRESLSLGGARRLFVAGPAGGWDVNLSGQVEADPDGRETARRMALLEFGDALRGRGGAALSLAGWSDLGGRRLAVVRVTWGDTQQDLLFIDDATGELAAWRELRGGQVWRVDYGDWRVIDGVRMPFVRRDQAFAGAGALASTQINHPFDAALFERPAGAALASFAGGARTSGWIPFELRAGSIVFHARLNGRDTAVWLDNGAALSLVDAAYSRELGLAPRGATTLSGVSGQEDGALAGGLTVEVGDLRLRDLTVVTLDTAPIADMVGEPVPFVLGDEAFNELAVDIDFARRRLAFRAPDAALPDRALGLPLIRSGDGRMLPAAIDKAPLRFALDLGNSGALSVFFETAQARRLPDPRRRQGVAMEGGIGGAHVVVESRVGRLDFAGAVFRDAPASFEPRGAGGTHRPGQAGLLGTAVVGRFHVIVDYPHDRLVVVGKADQTRPLSVDRIGASLVREGDVFVVLLVAPRSPAEHAGLRAGDRIKALDGEPATAWPLSRRRAWQEAAAPGARMTWTLEDGATRTITVADYY